MAAFDKLDAVQKRNYLSNMKLRKERYLALLQGSATGPFSFILIGDRPGPGAPKNTGYHHTPFYSTNNSSFWLNFGLLSRDIAESSLLWINSHMHDGQPFNVSLLKDYTASATVVALGENAAKWAVKNGVRHYKVPHPQFWKRFKSKEVYPLFELMGA